MAVLARRPSKSAFAGGTSTTKFLCVNTVSDKVIRHSLSYIRMQKWFVVDVPILVKIWPKLTNPLQKTLILDKHFRWCDSAL